MTEETKADKFERLARFRADKAVFAIGQLGHLRRSDYESTPDQRRAVISEIEEAAAGLRKAWGMLPGPMLTATDVQARQAAAIDTDRKHNAAKNLPPAAQAVDAVGLARKAEGGATLENEIRWAIDMIARGDYDTATSRLKRCLGYGEEQ